ncbi:DUF4097 family beta strand repeat-containing protein [Rossellomorea sp. BNER]|uniref:DUF4097 family beta strand repeat-containing protein n=1 Tax=Rossellomorea sp. BNER TaxID=2962031 RepID=UPI003AF1F58B|nr:DUF4097 domain-containing protein [Rossellomorea sp. BNER]
MKKIVLLIVGVGIIGVGLMSFQQSSFSKVNIHKEDSVNSKTINEIKISTSSADVEMIPTNGNEIYVLLTGKMTKDLEDKYELEINQSNHTLKIDYIIKNDSLGLKFGSFKDTKIQIKVPSKTFETIQVFTSSGDISIDEVKTKILAAKSTSGDQSVSGTDIVKQLVLQSSSGNIDTNGNETTSTDLHSTSGNIDINHLHSQKSVFETTSGNIRLKDERLQGGMEFKSSSGDIDIHFQHSPESFKVDFKGDSGEPNINIDGILFKEKKENRAVGVKGTGEFEIKVTTGSGDLNIDESGN